MWRLDGSVFTVASNDYYNGMLHPSAARTRDMHRRCILSFLHAA